MKTSAWLEFFSQKIHFLGPEIAPTRAKIHRKSYAFTNICVYVNNNSAFTQLLSIMMQISTGQSSNFILTISQPIEVLKFNFL